MPGLYGKLEICKKSQNLAENQIENILTKSVKFKLNL